MDSELNHKAMATRASTSSDSTSVTWSDSAAAAAEEEEEDCGCENSECGGDAMIKNELEAAEALTSLAHSTRCSNQRAGPSQRVKTESTTVDAVANLELSLRLSSDPPEDQAAVAQQQCENICTVMMEGAKVEQDAELPEPSPKCSTSYASFCGSKSRKKLTEAEKEEKRIRRVLANRESARQTIRRRQANHAELTRKAASLTLENLNLKQEKELAVSEYEHLRSRNEYLKAQMAMTEGEVEETKIDSKSTNADISTPLCPYFIYNQPPYTPFLWPAIIQPSNPVQIKNGSQNSIIVPSDVPMPAIAKPNSFQEQENPQNINSPGTPLFIMPCPWFFPFPDHGNGLQSRPSFDLNDEQNGTLMNNQGSANSSSIAHAEKHHHSLPINVKTEASGSTEAMPANVVVSSTVSHTVTVLSELKQDLIVCSSKKNMDAVAAAAEARKKRKELTKLKNLHCRQFRMRC
ncbi:uncharacterized protein LOC114266668 [Camellia sinensis]|uniref:uncharacterized protein LOC114266668 n=1 Tax=Camellia sinensis TaxID=4442 RepID=UPI0010357BAE|nr:uncharacterized protein LOC114266668 [Camellia sinensis]